MNTAWVLHALRVCVFALVSFYCGGQGVLFHCFTYFLDRRIFKINLYAYIFTDLLLYEDDIVSE